MSSKVPTVWNLPKHTESKHRILRAYFGAWLAILCQQFKKVAYVDGFCGPGEYTGGEPGSPTIVIDEAVKALNTGKVTPLAGFGLHLWFNDDDHNRIEHLKQILDGKMAVDQRVIVHAPTEGGFEKAIDSILKSLSSHPGPIPLFVFIDPFGATGFSMSTIERILKREGAEIFLLFDVDGVDRILMAPCSANDQTLSEVFGVPATEFQVIREAKDQKTRIVLLRDKYTQCLRDKRIATGILPFRMYNSKQQPLHDMMFLTNNRLGFVKMKEAMWRADATGAFRFSEADIDQIGLPLESIEQRLWRSLQKEFGGKTVSGEDVRLFVELQTLFLNKHKTDTLRLQEPDEPLFVPPGITVTRPNTRGAQGYSDQVSIYFHPPTP